MMWRKRLALGAIAVTLVSTVGVSVGFSSTGSPSFFSGQKSALDNDVLVTKRDLARFKRFLHLAQMTLPPGSYQGSCDCDPFDGTTLRCNCVRDDCPPFQ